jgi:hypothetical protein
MLYIFLLFTEIEVCLGKVGAGNHAISESLIQSCIGLFIPCSNVIQCHTCINTSPMSYSYAVFTLGVYVDLNSK